MALKRAELTKLNKDQLIAKYKELTGSSFKESDIKDLEDAGLIDKILDTDFDQRHATLLNKEKKDLIIEIEKLRNESKDNRTSLSDLKTKLNKLADQQDDDEIKKMIESGEYDKAISKLNETVKTLKPKASAYDELDTQERTKIKTRLGDDYIPAFDKMTLAELTQVADKIKPIQTKQEPSEREKLMIKAKEKFGDKFKEEEFKNLTEQQINEKLKTPVNNSNHTHMEKTSGKTPEEKMQGLYKDQKEGA